MSGIVAVMHFTVMYLKVVALHLVDQQYNKAFMSALPSKFFWPHTHIQTHML